MTRTATTLEVVAVRDFEVLELDRDAAPYVIGCADPAAAQRFEVESPPVHIGGGEPARANAVDVFVPVWSNTSCGPTFLMFQWMPRTTNALVDRRC